MPVTMRFHSKGKIFWLGGSHKSNFQVSTTDFWPWVFQKLWFFIDCDEMSVWIIVFWMGRNNVKIIGDEFGEGSRNLGAVRFHVLQWVLVHSRHSRGNFFHRFRGGQLHFWRFVNSDDGCLDARADSVNETVGERKWRCLMQLQETLGRGFTWFLSWLVLAQMRKMWWGWLGRGAQGSRRHHLQSPPCAFEAQTTHTNVYTLTSLRQFLNLCT